MTGMVTCGEFRGVGQTTMKTTTCLMRPTAILGLLLMACGNPAPAPEQGTPTTSTPSAGQSAVSDDLSERNVLQVAIGSPDHKTLVAAVQHVKYEDVLVNAGPFTVYAPTDAAFNALPAGTLDDLLKPENKAKLQDILEYHVALGVLPPEKMSDGRSVGMANGGNVKFGKTGDGAVMINDAKVLGSVPASNGLVVVIDKVLLPQ
jgi:uncharacterized surface protein with fasciclin (FAS1) repeats